MNNILGLAGFTLGTISRFFGFLDLINSSYLVFHSKTLILMMFVIRKCSDVQIKNSGSPL